MGIEAAVLGPILGATIGTAGSFITQSANASAQSSINKKTMEFNRVEAEKARNFSAAQAVIDRQFNSAQAAAQRQFAAEQGAIGRNYDAQQALLARQFEERMSSSAHQREVNDLRLAGLNPVLSATGGSGASTPVAPVVGAPVVSGSAASHSGTGTAQASVSGLNAYMKQDILSKFVNTALDGMRLSNDFTRAKAEDLNAKANWMNAQTKKYGEEWRYYLENKKVNISNAEANARIDKLNNEIKIAWEDLDIRKDLRDVTVEERKAMVRKLDADVEVSKEQAALLGLNQEELKRKMKYGNVLMTYLPADIRDKVASHMIDFVAENGDILNLFLHKSGGDIFEFDNGGEFFHKVVEPKINDWLKKKGW